MEKIQLNRTDLKIAPIIFGGNVFSWTLDKNASFDILDSYVDRGFNAIDTANQYSYWVPGNRGGESEAILGSWMAQRGNRDKIILMTKVGGVYADNPRPNTTSAHILIEVEHSLRRLQTDYIDLYQTHFDQVETPIEETLRAYEELIKQGKVRYIGASNLSPERLEASIQLSKQTELPMYKTLQPEYNLYSREGFEQGYQVLAERHELSVIPFYSLASGFLTGKYQNEADFSESPRSEGVKMKYWNDRGIKIISTVLDLASQYDTTASAVSLAWLLAKPSVAAPIASATKKSHLESFSQAVELALSPDDIGRLDEASRY
ncbi:aldo/keto reductase [Sphingobacterium shayense]|uniref:aldo/keto reductase n=1 Tax=Sphingobacterium shayense TaxID=626343 RepID=UPI001557B791|nr:aldo/keto reductase [Sphingobacterium shayense]NQD70551.1 aldo/keto reductase [Sphingobacterium shayense]